MFDKDNTLLGEAYIRMKTIVEDKALTPDQIANNAQAAGSAGKKAESLPKNKDEDKATLKTLEEVPYTDQHADNFTQDGVDKKVKDRYTLKEGDEAAAVDAFYNGKKKVVKEDTAGLGDTAPEGKTEKVDLQSAFKRTPEQHEQFEALVVDITDEFAQALITIDDEIKEIGGEFNSPAMRREIGMLLSRILEDFKRGKLPQALRPEKEAPEKEAKAEPSAEAPAQSPDA